MKIAHFIDQYGTVHHAHSRKELCASLGRSSSSAKIIYADKLDGTTEKIGYVVAGLWCRAFTWATLK